MQVYIPEADPANKGDFRSGPYAIAKTRLRTGGLAEIKKFNEGGINYLPSAKFLTMRMMQTIMLEHQDM